MSQILNYNTNNLLIETNPLNVFFVSKNDYVVGAISGSLVLTHKTTKNQLKFSPSTLTAPTKNTITELVTVIQGYLDEYVPTPRISNATATTTSSELLAENKKRKQLVITNTGSVAVFINTETTAVLNKGIYLAASGGVWEMDSFTFTTDSIHGITASSTTNISIYEV